ASRGWRRAGEAGGGWRPALGGTIRAAGRHAFTGATRNTMRVVWEEPFAPGKSGSLLSPAVYYASNLSDKLRRPGREVGRDKVSPRSGGAAMQEIADWLEKLGMSEYAQPFSEHKIDVSVLGHLTDQDLKDIGIPLGHRRKILAAIGELTGAAAATPKPPAR